MGMLGFSFVREVLGSQHWALFGSAILFLRVNNVDSGKVPPHSFIRFSMIHPDIPLPWRGGGTPLAYRWGGATWPSSLPVFELCYPAGKTTPSFHRR